MRALVKGKIGSFPPPVLFHQASIKNLQRLVYNGFRRNVDPETENDPKCFFTSTIKGAEIRGLEQGYDGTLEFVPPENSIIIKMIFDRLPSRVDGLSLEDAFYDYYAEFYGKARVKRKWVEYSLDINGEGDEDDEFQDLYNEEIGDQHECDLYFWEETLLPIDHINAIYLTSSQKMAELLRPCMITISIK